MKEVIDREVPVDVVKRVAYIFGENSAAQKALDFAAKEGLDKAKFYYTNLNTLIVEIQKEIKNGKK